jgi:hypothetical protein
MSSVHSLFSQSYFAQEIIDLIIDELSSDLATLERCSTVTRSFQLSARRHLFSVIDLISIKLAVQFHRLLISAPDIAFNVRILYVRINPYYNTLDTIVGKWYENSILLAEILEMLPSLHTLYWSLYQTFVSWNELSCGLRSALVNLFPCPSLTTIVMTSHPYGFPLSAFHLSPVKRLHLYRFRLD